MQLEVEGLSEFLWIWPTTRTVSRGAPPLPPPARRLRRHPRGLLPSLGTPHKDQNPDPIPDQLPMDHGGRFIGDLVSNAHFVTVARWQRDHNECLPSACQAWTVSRSHPRFGRSPAAKPALYRRLGHTNNIGLHFDSSAARASSASMIPSITSSASISSGYSTVTMS